jgi:opacity protein-like surface antigen
MKIKNYLLLTAAILTTVSSGEAGKFYAGAGAMYTQSYSTLRLSSVRTPGGGPFYSTVTAADSSSGIGPRIFAGYERDHNNFFYSGEIIGSFQDMSWKKSLGIIPASNATGGGLAIISLAGSVKYTRNYTVGVRGKMGGHVSDNLSAFVGLGVINSQFKVAYGDAALGQVSDKKSVFGVEPSAGISYKLSSKWRLGLEYLYQQYGTFTTKNLNQTAGYTTNIKSKFKFGTAFVSVSYVI